MPWHGSLRPPPRNMMHPAAGKDRLRPGRWDLSKWPPNGPLRTRNRKGFLARHGDLRRLAEMTQQRSFEVTRARNGIRDGTRRIIHAAGVCVDVREIRAISSTPQACGVVSHHPRQGRVTR
jgi:hypothetical protein